MTYHTNHCWCSESIYNDKNFDGEVMVYLGETVTDIETLSEGKEYRDIIDCDWETLTQKESFFDKERYDIEIENKLKRVREFAKGFTDKSDKEKEDILNVFREDMKEVYQKSSVTLKPEVIIWLDKNVKDKLNTKITDPLEDRKAWAIGNLKYNSATSYQITIFFDRQLDALSFIKEWSIYKKPTYYFDYFHDDRREIDIEEFVKITNEHYQLKGIPKLDIPVKELREKQKKEISTNLDQDTYTMLDWELEEEC